MEETLLKKIIGLGYKARHGKDSAAKAMVGEFDHTILPDSTLMRVVKTSFAAALKQEVEALAKAIGGMENLAVLFNLAALSQGKKVIYDPNPPMDDPDCPSGKQRSILQWYGTDFWRKKDPDHWVKKVAASIKEIDADVFLIPDVRFKNEANWIRSEGGIVVKVTCPNLPADKILTNQMTHESEVQLDGFDFDHEIIAWYGEMSSLAKQALIVFRHYVFGEK